MRDERDLKVGAYQLPPKVILAAFRADALPHKVNLINYYLPWGQTNKRKKHVRVKSTVYYYSSRKNTASQDYRHKINTTKIHLLAFDFLDIPVLHFLQ